MANSQDARPFVDLKKDAEEFQEKFDEDIKECIDFLDAKITNLICDPDSLGDSVRTARQNALLEFSKAKYDVFISVKSLMNTKEREWLNYISEMKKLFIENVEIFLAGTKLEVKLPPSEFQPSPGPRKSPSNRKSNSSVASSIMSNIARTIPGLSSSLNRDSANKEDLNVGNKAQSNRSSRLSAKLCTPPNTTAARYDSSDSSEGEISAVENQVQFNRRSRLPPKSPVKRLTARGRQSAASIKLANSQRIALEEDEELDTEEESYLGCTEETEIKVEEDDAGMYDSYIPVSQNQVDVTVSGQASTARGRRGKQSAQNSKLNDVADSALQNSKKLPSRSSRQKKDADLKENDHRSEEIKETKIVETSINNVKSRKGRARTKNNINLADPKEIDHHSEEVEETQKLETNISHVKSRKGRARTKNNLNLESHITESSDSPIEEEPITEVVKVRGRRGRAAAVKETNISDEIAVTKTPAKGRKSIKIMDETNQPGTSKTPKSVFASQAINDDLDIYSPVARPAKTSARRKTLLPNLEDVSGSEIIPGNPTRTMSKRKTIGGVSDLQSAAPSKRLRVGRGKNVPSIEEDNDANDNLLESDDNYSDWMALKSVDGKIPTLPAIYEAKVWRAKKPAYIGCCDSLRQRLTLHKLRQNSGHKQLDKFIERNYDDIQVRFEVVSSVNEAKDEVKTRISHFVKQYKTTPAYN